nr:hypothetical protein [Tanacetum cinerariifolium]
MISGWLLAVVDKARLGGLGGCIYYGGSIVVIAGGRLWEGGVGKGSAVFLKTLSKTKSRLFQGSLSVSSARSSLQSLVRELA